MNISMILDDDLAEALEEEAKNQGVTRINVIRNYLRDGLRRSEAEQLPGTPRYRKWARVWDKTRPGWRTWPVVEKPVPLTDSPKGLCPECLDGDYHCKGNPSAYPVPASVGKMLVKYQCKCPCVDRPEAEPDVWKQDAPE